MDLVPQLALLGRRIGTEHERSSDVGLIAVDRAGAVHQHDLAALDDLRLVAAVRISRGLADQHQAAVIIAAKTLLCRGDHRVDIARAPCPSRVRSPA